MKRVRLSLLAISLLISGNLLAVSAKQGPLDKPTSKICKQIAHLLEANPFELNEGEYLRATLRFTLNEEHEIVVLSVDTENERLEGFVKARLNYHTADSKNLQEGKVYEVPIRITA